MNFADGVVFQGVQTQGSPLLIRTCIYEHTKSRVSFGSNGFTLSWVSRKLIFENKNSANGKNSMQNYPIRNELISQFINRGNSILTCIAVFCSYFYFTCRIISHKIFTPVFCHCISRDNRWEFDD